MGIFFCTILPHLLAYSPLETQSDIDLCSRSAWQPDARSAFLADSKRQPIIRDR